MGDELDRSGIESMHLDKPPSLSFRVADEHLREKLHPPVGDPNGAPGAERREVTADWTWIGGTDRVEGYNHLAAQEPRHSQENQARHTHPGAEEAVVMLEMHNVRPEADDTCRSQYPAASALPPPNPLDGHSTVVKTVVSDPFSPLTKDH